MTGLPRRYWQDMTTAEFAALDVERTIAVLPVGAIEQHGPHLPVWVDACLTEGILARAVARMPESLPVTILPLQAVGWSDEHLAFPGTLSLSPETLRRVWTELAEGVRRHGIRKLVIFNAHGGQPQIMEIVARDLRVRHEMFVVSASWYGFGLPEGLFAAEEVKHGIHAGAIETSMMLHLHPELVQMDKAVACPPLSLDLERDYRHLRRSGKVAFAWQAQDLHPSGVAGDPTTADAEAGRRVVEHAAEALVELLAEVDRFPLSALKQR
jgi:creatinine amidohydrolase